MIFKRIAGSQGGATAIVFDSVFTEFFSLEYGGEVSPAYFLRDSQCSMEISINGFTDCYSYE